MTYKPRLFLDCDGVLADFDTHALEVFGRPAREHEDEVGSDVFWTQLREHGTFYRTMPLMSDAKILYERVKHLNPTILTGCPKDGWAEQQKIEWAKEHFPDMSIITCKSSQKSEWANPSDVLVDDWPRYRHKWIRVGGMWIDHHDAKTSADAVLAYYSCYGF